MTTWGPAEADDDPTEQPATDLVTSATGDELEWGTPTEADDATEADDEFEDAAVIASADDDAEDDAIGSELATARAEQDGTREAADADVGAEHDGTTEAADDEERFEPAADEVVAETMVPSAPVSSDPDLPTMADLDALSAELDAVDATLVALDARSPAGDLDTGPGVDLGTEADGHAEPQPEPAG